ncbi:helix-turn-helix transcriptional regulator [Proteobacteria bacterium 005FR1]|nr:helix-turn-helix transcriptional regulator [Proteobacteria bacterium 005FR1]
MKITASDSKSITPPDLISLTEYDELVGAILDGGLDDQAMGRALEALRKRCRANYVTLILRIPSVGDVGLMLVAGDIGAPGQVSRQPYHHGVTPFRSQPVDTIYTEQDIMSSEQWQSSSYYREVCKKQNVNHVMGADISLPDEGVFRFRVTRPHGAEPFSDRDRALCQMLLPHLRRSLRIHNQLDRSESLGGLYARAINRLSVATIVLDETGTVLQLNDVAKGMLDNCDGLKLVGGRLEASYPSDNKELYRRVREAFEAQARGERLPLDALPVARPSGEVSLGVVVEPVPEQSWAETKGQPALVLYVRDAVGKSQVSNVAAMRLFDFTPAETALALELANGLSLEEAAENLGIMRNTARAHLRAIFSKTGVRRQAELVRVILNSVITLGSDAVKPLASNEVQ